MSLITIDSQMEAVKQVIRNGGKAVVATPMMDELFGAKTDADRLEDAMDSLVRLTMAKMDQAASAGSPDSYERL